MSLVTRYLKQTAVYWGNPVSDGSGGRTFDDPIEVDVRWEEKGVMFRNITGQEVRSNAVVYVGQDMVLGGYLYLGTLDTLDSDEEASPLIVDDAFEIRGWDKIPDIKGTEFLRRAWL